MAATSTAEADALTAERETLLAEARWFLDTECVEVIGELRKLLHACVASLEETSPNSQMLQMRCGSEEEGLTVHAVVGSTALHALRVQLTQHSSNYGALLAGGSRACITLPSLLTSKNCITRALGTLARGYRSLSEAHETISQAVMFVSDAVNAIALQPIPGSHPSSSVSAPQHSQPSSIASAVTQALQPEAPPEVVVDVCVAGSPPRFYFSAYACKGPERAVVDSWHVVGFSDGLEERVALLGGCLTKARSLLSKAEMLLEITRATPEPTSFSVAF